jgi:hypothetical protein
MGLRFSLFNKFRKGMSCMKKKGGRDLFLRFNPLPAALFSSDFYEGLCFYFDLYERLSVSISWIEQILLPFEKSFSFLLFLKFLDITLPPILVGIGNLEPPFSRIGNLKRIVFPLFTPLGGTAKGIEGFLEGCSTLLLPPFSSLWERIPPLLLWGEQILPPLLRLGGELLFLLKEGGEILFFSASSLLLLLVEGGSLSLRVISSFLTSLFLTLNGLEYPLRNLLSIAGGDGTLLRTLFHSLHPTVQHWFSPLLPLLRGIGEFLQEGVFGDRLGVRGLDLLLRGVGFSTTLLLLYSSLHGENRSFYRGMSEKMLRIRAQQDVHCDIFMLAKVKGELYRERLRLGKSSVSYLQGGTDSASPMTEMQDFLYNIAQREILRERGELGGEVLTSLVLTPPVTSVEANGPPMGLGVAGQSEANEPPMGLGVDTGTTSSLSPLEKVRDELPPYDPPLTNPLGGQYREVTEVLRVTPLNILEEVWEFERSRIMKRGVINPPSAEEAQAAIYKTIEKSLSHLEEPTRQIFEGDGNPPFRVGEGFSANVMALWIEEQMITSRRSDEYEEALLKQFRGVFDYQTNLFKWEDEEIERLSHLQLTLQQKAREDERELTESFEEKERNFRKDLLRETVEQGEKLLAETKYLLEQRKQVREEREEFLKEKKRWRDKVLQRATEEIENNERLRRAYFHHVYRIMFQDIEVEKWKARNGLGVASAAIHKAEILNERGGALQLASTERIKMWMYNADIKLQNWRMREQKLLRQHYRMGTMDEVERQTGILKALFQEEKKRMEGERDELVQLYIQRLMEVKGERDEALSRLRPTSNLSGGNHSLPLSPLRGETQKEILGVTSNPSPHSAIRLVPPGRGNTPNPSPTPNPIGGPFASDPSTPNPIGGPFASSVGVSPLEKVRDEVLGVPLLEKDEVVPVERELSTGKGSEVDPLYGSGFDTDVKEVCNPLSPQSIPPVGGKEGEFSILQSSLSKFSIPLTGNCRGKWNLLSREKMKLLLKKRESFQYLERGNPLPLPGGDPLWGKEWGDSGGKREDLLFKRVTPKGVTPKGVTHPKGWVRTGVSQRDVGGKSEVPSKERGGLITLKWDSNFEKEPPSLTRGSPYPLGVTSFEVLGELPPLSSIGWGGREEVCFAGPQRVREGAPRREEGDPMGETPCPGSPVTPVRKVFNGRGDKEIQSEEELLVPFSLIPGTTLQREWRKGIGPSKEVLERYRVPRDQKEVLTSNPLTSNLSKRSQGEVLGVQPLWRRIAEWMVTHPKGWVRAKGGGEGVGLPPRNTPFSDSEWKESVKKLHRGLRVLGEGFIRIMTKPNRDEILPYEGGIECLKEVRKGALKKDKNHWEWYYPLLDDPHMFAEGRRGDIPLCFYESEAKELAEMEFAMKYHSGEGDPPLKGFIGYTLPPLPEPEKDPPGLPPSLPPPVFPREENPPQIPNPQPVPPIYPLFPPPVLTSSSTSEEVRGKSGVRGVSTRSERAFFGLPQEGADFIYYGVPHIEFIDSHSLEGNTSGGSSVDDFESQI